MKVDEIGFPDLNETEAESLKAAIKVSIPPIINENDFFHALKAFARAGNAIALGFSEEDDLGILRGAMAIYFAIKEAPFTVDRDGVIIPKAVDNPAEPVLLAD